MHAKFTLFRMALVVWLAMGIQMKVLAQKDTIPPVITGTCGDTLKVEIASVWLFQMPPIHDDQTDSADIVVLKTWSGNGPVNTLIRGYYILELDAVDSSGNKTHCTICYKVDDFIGPVINLNTPDTICIERNVPYQPVQPTATDNYYPANQISVVQTTSDITVCCDGFYYEVWLATDASGNKTIKTRYVIVQKSCSGTGITNLLTERFFISPNPASDYIEVNPVGATGTFCICSIDGKKVFESGSEDPFRVDIHDWANGVYCIQFNDGIRMQVVKFVVHH